MDYLLLQQILRMSLITSLLLLVGRILKHRYHAFFGVTFLFDLLLLGHLRNCQLSIDNRWPRITVVALVMSWPEDLFGMHVSSAPVIFFGFFVRVLGI